jgi:hypothetical protein
MPLFLAPMSLLPAGEASGELVARSGRHHAPLHQDPGPSTPDSRSSGRFGGGTNEGFTLTGHLIDL